MHPLTCAGENHVTKMAYMPFSHGPRDCVGQSLAMLELRVVLATLLSKIKQVFAHSKLPVLPVGPYATACILFTPLPASGLTPSHPFPIPELQHLLCAMMAS